MHIGVLEAGYPPGELAEKYGTYADMIQRLLSPLNHSWSFQAFRVRDGAFPESPAICDAWIVSGSRHGAYETLPWIVSLKNFLHDSVTQGIPVIGFCFGHQILAMAMGGKVQKSEKGWGLGTHTYTLKQPPPFAKAPPSSPCTDLSLYAVHQDQVTDLPPDALVVASSDFCPYAALAYGNIAFSIQAHPEFSKDFEKNLLMIYRGSSFSEDHADGALRALEAPSPAINAEIVAHWIHDLLTHPRNKKPMC